MSAFRGAITGALSLIALQAVVSSDASATRTGQLFTDVSSLITRAFDPAVPLIPDLRNKSTGAGTSAKPSAAAAGSGTGTATLPSYQFDPSHVPVTPVPRTTPSVPAPVIAPSSTTRTA